MTLTIYSPLNQFHLIVSSLSFLILLYFQPRLVLGTTVTSSLVVLLLRLAYKRFWVYKSASYRNKGSVLITGCSSGIGAASAKRFLELGYHVMCTFRKQEDVQAFEEYYLGVKRGDGSSPDSPHHNHHDTSQDDTSKKTTKHANLVHSAISVSGKSIAKDIEARFTPLILDVSDADSIARNLPSIRKVHKKYPLIALINNAGLQVSGIVECLDIENHVKKSFDVNVIGIYRMVKCLIPLLRESHKRLGRARIINISSVAGLTALPTATGYSATKWAVQALSQGLRNELARFGIEVCTVNPGSTRTNFRVNAKAELERILSEATPEMKSKYYPEYFSSWQKRYDAYFKEGEGYEEGKGFPVEKVVNVLEETIETSHLQSSYLIGPEAVMASILGILPERIGDLALRKTYKI